ncbi:MAG: carboxy terminal-processing peptidase, partial [Bacteroidota bacterium]
DIDDAIKMIRGAKGTEVRLTVKKIDGNEQEIPIVRDVVLLEETYARSLILQADKGKKIGYIQLPKFYTNFNSRDGRRCATDVRKEITKLKSQNVKGLIIDLRDNGGGSLNDVVEMSGLFIDKGPIVQVKSRQRDPDILPDTDAGVHYDGPLIIMVNSLSASASEIMAAAIQDYGRGIIIGSKSTFGKGTVQRFLNLDQLYRGPDDVKPLGEVKLTTQKFYRINGGATQLKGVVPDIVLPDEYSRLDLGEKDREFSMAWDEIDPVAYEKWDANYNISKLRAASEARVAENPTFQLILENAERLKRRQDQRDYQLNLEEFRTETDQLSEESKKYEDLEKEIEALKIESLSADIDYIEADDSRKERREKWLKQIQSDPYVYEALLVMKDMK